VLNNNHNTEKGDGDIIFLRGNSNRENRAGGKFTITPKFTEITEVKW